MQTAAAVTTPIPPTAANEDDARLRIAGADLLALAPFIRLDRVRAGDVLLTLGNGLNSALISTVTGGSSSHAALWLPVGDEGWLQLAESDGAGVGYTPLPLWHLEPASRSTPSITACRIPGSPQRCRLLRHPQMATISADKLAGATQRLQERAFHRSYSQWRRLAGSAGLAPSLESMAASLLGFADRFREADPVRGAFCSELVAMFFEELGLPLFADPRPPEKVSPGDLERPGCRLVPVEDAFVEGDALRSMSTLAPEALPRGLQRGPVLEAMTGNQRAAHHVRQVVGEFEQRIDALKQYNMEVGGQLARQILDSLLADARKATLRGFAATNGKLLGFAARAALAVSLHREIFARDRMECDPQRTAAQRGNWSQAQLRLHALQHDLQGGAQRAHLNHAVRFALLLIRAQLAEPDLSWWRRMRLRRQRHVFLRDMRETRAGSAKARAFADEALATTALPPASQALIDEVVTAAQQAVLLDEDLATRMAATRVTAPRRDIPADSVLGAELDRIQRRRLAADRPRSREVFGLALSGGGIRSATVSLGVLQGLARAGLLHRFDYLSTVSGGGYIGSFFTSLFRRPLDRDDDGNDKGHGMNAAATGRDAERILAEDFSRRPPDYAPSARPPGWQLQWLRKGSRYLAPSGAGDYLYAVALVLRNLVAIHYVLGLALVLAVLAAIGVDWGVRLLAFEVADLHGLAAGVGLLMLSGLIGALWVAPSALAYFAAETPKSDDGRLPWWSTRTFWSFIAAIAVAIGLSWWVGSFDDDSPASETWRLGVARGLAALAVLMLLAVAMLLVVGTLARHRAGRGETSQARLLQGIRVDLTQVLAHGLSPLVAALSAAALLLLVPHLREYTAKLVAAAVAAAPAARFLMSLLPQRKKDNEASPGWLQWLASAAGVLAFTLLVVAWTLAADALVATWLMPAAPAGVSGFAATTSVLLLLALAFATGRSFQFLNLTTIQRMYASRIIRTYLGASNAERSKAGSRSAWQRISEAHPRDDLPRSEYYAADAWERGAPLHLINVTINQTVSETDPLVQRDRKGRPLVVSPCALGVDGLWYDWDAPAHERGKPVQLEPLTIGNWIGISGAAFSTGLGRATSLGKSMLFTVSNVRLGHWWKAWPEERAPRKRGPLDLLARGMARVFTTQAYLASELFARFSGTQLPYWYLTDGGHFENTGVYELLRRRVGMVLACDNGADPNYQLEDLANLMRLARIDMGYEFVRLVRADFGPAADAPRWLNAVIDEQRLTRGDGSDGGRAMLFYAYRPLEADGFDNGTALVVLKPRLAHSTPLDVLEYAATSPTFPQETTADQFFDEGQWESYRRLGAAQCEDLFAAAGINGADQVDGLTRLRDDMRVAARNKLVKRQMA